MEVQSLSEGIPASLYCTVFKNVVLVCRAGSGLLSPIPVSSTSAGE